MKKRVIRQKAADNLIIMAGPVALGTVMFFIVYKHLDPILHAALLNRFDVICETLLSIWGTLLGFMVTVVSILLTLGEGNKYLETQKRIGNFKTVIISYSLCCMHLFAALVYLFNYNDCYKCNIYYIIRYLYGNNCRHKFNYRYLPILLACNGVSYQSGDIDDIFISKG